MSEKMRRAHEIFDHLGYGDAAQDELDEIAAELWQEIANLRESDSAPKSLVASLAKIAGRLDDLDLSTLRGAA